MAHGLPNPWIGILLSDCCNRNKLNLIQLPVIATGCYRSQTGAAEVHNEIQQDRTPGGSSSINVTGGRGGYFFWVEDLTVYFFGSEKSVRIFLGSNFRQANSSYAIQAKVPARSESMIRIICM